jgi:8-oxo-dGTP pyrophosphatase MutT (NUDIX family)
MDVLFIQDLESRLEKPLPGFQAQSKMAGYTADPSFYVPGDDHSTASVLILLFPKGNVWNFALIERSNHDPNDKHAGQISLPGGKMDDNDKTLEDCALRETYEEIGINPSLIGILGGLSPLFVRVSNFLVHPFVGFTTEYPRFILQSSEVANVYEVPVNILTDHSYKKTTDIEVRNMLLKDIPAYDVYGKNLWGATAMILSEFEAIIKEID